MKVSTPSAAIFMGEKFLYSNYKESFYEENAIWKSQFTWSVQPKIKTSNKWKNSSSNE